jgi:hypothetical protein
MRDPGGAMMMAPILGCVVEKNGGKLIHRHLQNYFVGKTEKAIYLAI